MTTRVLPPEEWHLVPVDAEMPAGMDPARNQIVVTERDGVMTGCLVLMQVLHAECLWIAPAYRGRVSVFRRLREALYRYARDKRYPTVLMSALGAPMSEIVTGLGADRLPGDHYVLTLREVV